MPDGSISGSAPARSVSMKIQQLVRNLSPGSEDPHHEAPQQAVTSSFKRPVLARSDASGSTVSGSVRCPILSYNITMNCTSIHNHRFKTILFSDTAEKVCQLRKCILSVTYQMFSECILCNYHFKSEAVPWQPPQNRHLLEASHRVFRN